MTHRPPIAKIVKLDASNNGVSMAYVRCPYCQKLHCHGAPDLGDNARRRRRAAHCHIGEEYLIAPIESFSDTSASELHVLYRFFNATQLLYVGITVNPGGRFRTHQREKSWWLQVTTITLQKYSTRSELEAAELQAIRTEFPLHNIAGVLPNQEVVAGATRNG